MQMFSFFAQQIISQLLYYSHFQQAKSIMSLLYSFTRYGLIGIVNTAVHWLIFFSCFYYIFNSQAISNTIAFLVAVTISFFLNAYFTFNTHTNIRRYVMFSSFMGAISFLTGGVADKIALPPLYTLIIFTLLSFVVGFLWSKYWVFKK